MKKILKILFKKAVAEIESDAVEEYSRFSDSEVLNNAIHGFPFYIRGNSGKDGQHHLYRFDPVDMGLNRTFTIGPDRPPEPVYWKDAKPVKPPKNRDVDFETGKETTKTG